MIVEKFGSDAADAVNILSNASCTLEGSAKQVAGEPFHCVSFFEVGHFADVRKMANLSVP